MNKSERLEKLKYSIKNNQIYIKKESNYKDFQVASFILIELKEKIKFKNKKTKFFCFYFYKKNTKINLFLDSILYEYINLKNINVSKQEIKNVFLIWY